MREMAELRRTREKRPSRWRARDPKKVRVAVRRGRLAAAAAWVPILGGATVANAIHGPGRAIAVAMVLLATVFQFALGRRVYSYAHTYRGYYK